MEKDMLRPIKQKKTAVGFLIFIGCMWICTLISKSIYASGLPQAAVEYPEKRRIEHVVETDGIIKQGGDVAVHTPAGLRVEKIYVRAGDEVEAGDLLFRLDQESLKEIIEDKKLEAAKLKYQIDDLKSGRELTEAEKQKKEARAAEDYAGAKEQADTALRRADTALNQAADKLDAHKENGVLVTPEGERQAAQNTWQQWVDRGKEMEATVSGNQVSVAEKKKKLQAAEQSGKEAEIQKAGAELKTAEEMLAAAQNLYSAYLENPLTEPDFSAEDSAKQAWEAETKALEGTLQSSQYGREDALTKGAEEIKNAQRSLEDAEAADKPDSTLEIYQMEYEKLERDLEKYQRIKAEEGAVSSEVSGTVTNINLTVGEMTPEGAAVVCADREIPCQFEATITKEQKKYVNQGDTVILKMADKKKAELTIDYLAEEENNPGAYRAVVYLPEKEGTIGMSATLTKSEVSESYACCVPAEALHGENNGNRYFVYLMKEREGILGTEKYVEKRYVKVLDQNDSYAALEEGSLSGEDQVITDVDQEIENHMVIRLREE